jgi:hypothetical protein
MNKELNKDEKIKIINQHLNNQNINLYNNQSYIKEESVSQNPNFDSIEESKKLLLEISKKISFLKEELRILTQDQQSDII